MNYYSGKTILVTGATGLLGSYLVEQLMNMPNVNVIALSRSEEKLKDIFSKYLSNPRFEIIARDASLEVPRIEKPLDVIFHAASPISGETIKNNPVDVIEPNIIGTIRYLDYLKEQDAENGVKGRLVLFSSATVYTNLGAEDRVVSEAETSIADTLDAANAPYSESKRMVEVLARAYHKQYGIDTVIARFSYIYGYSYFQPNTAFYEFIRKALHGEDITMNNSDIPRRDNIYVRDAVEALLYLGAYGNSAESYNISSGGEKENFMAVDEMAQIIAQIANEENNSGVSVKYLSPKEDKRKPGIVLCNEKIKTLGWQLKYSMNEGIKETIQLFIQRN